MAVHTQSKDTPSAQQPWFTQPYETVLKTLAVGTDGLTDNEAKTRLAQGYNELEEKGSKSVWSILYEQMTNPLVLLLVGAAAVSGLLGKWDSFFAIVAIVILNAILGVVQEFRAEQAMAALKKMSAPLVRVKRNGNIQDVPSREVVVGDIVLLEAGSVVPADGRLIETANLRVQEASLTGESQPVEKDIKPLNDANAPLGDHSNMVYMGTSVTYGRGLAVITSTGMRSQLGRIAELIQSVSAEKTPLQRRLDELGRVLFGAAIAVMVIAFIVGLIAGLPIIPEANDPKGDSVLLHAVAIAVAVVPEGLPAVVTIALALGAQRMLRRRALIRKLAAVETLGSVTTICSDKTGTLTQNRMTVRLVDVAGNSASIDQVIEEKEQRQPHNIAQIITLVGGALCNDALIQKHAETGEDELIGDPTEGALVNAAQKYGITQAHLRQVFPRMSEVPFDSDRKRMSTLHKMAQTSLMSREERLVVDEIGFAENEYIIFTKGGVDNLLAVSQHVYIDQHVLPMTPELSQRITLANNTLAQQGLRVLGVAYRVVSEVPEKTDVPSYENDLVFVGMVGIIDPPRQEVADAVKTCVSAGIRPIMITGDHPLTAFAIAKDLGIAKEGDRVLTGHDLNQISESELREVVKQVSVYARVSPENKLQIVSALQANGEVAAMTGDGVNDAPALKRANIGVAMGITGTAVSKEASDMVLLDDNFATIVSSVEEGRTIYDNVRRFIKYLLASNTGELFVLLATQLISGMGLPLTTLQILWMNLITDGIPALALGVEGAEKGAMKRPPYLPNESLFGRGLGRHIVIIGMIMGLTGLGLGIWAFNQFQNGVEGFESNTWNTMVFMFLTIAQMGHALGLRSHRESFFTLNFFSNKLLLGAVAVTVILQLVAVYAPLFNTLFNTTPLSLPQLALCFVLSLVVFMGVEIEKLLIRRGILK